MKRLTIDTDISFCDIAQCRETPGGSFCEYGHCDQRRVYERLREYERLGDLDNLTALAKARDEGLVMVLPCARNGAELYFADVFRGEIYKEAYTDGLGLFWTNSSDIGDYLPLSCIGKTVFLTRTEAEAALKGAANHEAD